MDKAGREAFQNQTQDVAEALNPADITIDGGASILCGLVVSDRDMELDKGGIVVLSSLVASVSKQVMPERPKRGGSVNYNGELYEIYNVSGEDAPRWIIRASTFPSKT